MDGVKTPFTSDSISELTELLADRPHLTHVLVGKDRTGREVKGFGRFFFPAIALYFHVLFAKQVDGGSIGTTTFFDERPVDDRQAARDAVSTCLDALRRQPDLRFALAWHIEGDAEVHLERSAHYTPDSALEELREYLEELG